MSRARRSKEEEIDEWQPPALPCPVVVRFPEWRNIDLRVIDERSYDIHAM